MHGQKNIELCNAEEANLPVTYVGRKQPFSTRVATHLLIQP